METIDFYRENLTWNEINDAVLKFDSLLHKEVSDKFMENIRFWYQHCLDRHDYLKRVLDEIAKLTYTDTSSVEPYN